MTMRFDRFNTWSENEAEGYTVEDWKEEVAFNNTRIGYVDWVLAKLQVDRAEDK